MRAANLRRVSTEEQVAGYSLDAQRRAFLQLVKDRGWEVYREYVEEGQSAHVDDIRKRPVFEQAMADALAGNYDVLVVHRIDRFSRNLRMTIEWFEKLGKAGVGFVSIENQIDYSTPEGKFMLAMQGGLAQLYSENLGREVRKGWAERRAQGLYCGLLAFGAKKGEDGVPVPDPSTHPGLRLMFEMASQGHSDRQIAAALNARGHRTAGNQGNRLFSKYTVKGILTNRFYIGFIPDGKGGWLKAKHDALITSELFEAAQEARRRNRRKPTRNVRSDARVSALSGLARCRSCGATLRTFRNRGVARMICNTRLKNSGCLEPSARTTVYEQALTKVFAAFKLPSGQKARVVNRRARAAKLDRPELGERQHLAQARERIADMFKWGHVSQGEYLKQREELDRAIEVLERSNPDDERLQEFTRLVNDVQTAWAAADEEGKNVLAHSILDAVWIENKGVVAVTPRPELTPLFDQAWQAAPDSVLHWRPRADLNRRSLP